MFSPLFLTAMNHHAPRQKARAKSSVGLLTLQEGNVQLKVRQQCSQGVPSICNLLLDKETL